MNWALLIQVPDPTDYDSSYQWVAVTAVILGIGAVGYLFQENRKLNVKMNTDVEKQRDDWKLQAVTCSGDFSKTSEALKVANDTTVLVVGKVDKLALMQDKLSEKLDRNFDQMRSCLTTMDRMNPTLEKLSARFQRDQS